jgi:DNA (cytosine-5)-methyltransferase 1
VGSGIGEPLPTVTSGAGAARPAGAAHAMGVVEARLSPCVMTNTTAHPGAGIDAPLPTQTTGNHHYLLAPTLVQTGYSERDGQSPRCLDLTKPLGTVVGDGKHAAVTAFLAKHFGGAVGTDLKDPASTCTSKDHQSLVAANLVRFNFDDAGVPIDAPLPTVTVSNHAALVYSFLVRYFGTAIGQHCTEPLYTITGKDRFGLVMVHVNGEPYVIVDIGMRMLTPRELARAQGFPDTYILTGSKRHGLVTLCRRRWRRCWCERITRLRR